VSDLIDLLQRAADGDRRAYDAAYAQVYPVLKRLARGQKRRAAPSDDANTTSIVNDGGQGRGRRNGAQPAQRGRPGAGPGPDPIGRDEFDALVDLTPAKRDAALAALAGESPALAAHVRGLLNADSSAGDDPASAIGDVGA
jgi:hypothetical protein